MNNSVLLVGLGQIGMGYDLHAGGGDITTHAKAFTLHPDFQLVGAVDPSPQLREIFTKQYGCAAYATVVQALEEIRPQIVVIATPTSTHLPLVQQVLALASPKAIFCEKPLAYSVNEADQMLSLCRQKGVDLWVNYIRRADPAVIEVKKRIQSAEIRSPIKAHVWYSKGFIHNGSHFFNLMEFWLGPALEHVVLDPGRLLPEQDAEPDVMVRFEQGAVVFQSAWEEEFSHYTVEMLSPSGRLRMESGGAQMLWQATTPHAPKGTGGALSQTASELGADMNRYQLNSVNQLSLALKGLPHTLCSGQEAKDTLQAMVKITTRTKTHE